MPLSAPCVTQASCNSRTEHLPCPPATNTAPAAFRAGLRAMVMRVCANAAIAAAFLVWTVLVLPWGLVPALILSLLAELRAGSSSDSGPGPRSRFQKYARVFVAFYGRGVLFLLRPCIPVTVSNAQAAVQAGPCIITPNHQSFLDLYLLGAQAQADLCLVSKHWPYRLLFFFAPVMRLAGYVDVEILRPEELENQCLERLRQGSTLVVFPEGRRTRDGALGRFHVGAFVLACKAGVPVVPMVIHNSRAVFPVGAKAFTPAAVRIDMLDPVYPQDFAAADMPHRAMQRRVRELFARQLQPAPQAE